MNDALLNKDDFVYEVHFPSYATWEFPLKFKAEGYEIHTLYMGLSNVDLSAMRVAMQAKKGGHHVPRWDIENNYFGNLEMLNGHFHLLDYLEIIDTSVFLPKSLATFKDLAIASCVKAEELPEWFSRYLPLLTSKIQVYHSV